MERFANYGRRKYEKAVKLEKILKSQFKHAVLTALHMYGDSDYLLSIARDSMRTYIYTDCDEIVCKTDCLGNDFEIRSCEGSKK